MSRLKRGEHEGINWVRGVVGWGSFSIKVFLYRVNGVLIDTGPTKLTKLLLPFISERNLEGAVLTHYHEDHSGNAPYLTSKGVPVYVNSKSVDRCREPTRLPLYRKWFWGDRKGFTPQPIAGEMELGGEPWIPIEVPGHVFDQVAYYLPRRGYLFTGDLLVTPRPRIVISTESTPQVINDLRRVLQYDFSTVFCSHAGIVHQGREVIQKKLEYLEKLQEEAKPLYRQGWSIAEITRHLFPRREPLEFISCKEWSPEHLVRSAAEDHPTKEPPWGR